MGFRVCEISVKLMCDNYFYFSGLFHYLLFMVISIINSCYIAINDLIDLAYILSPIYLIKVRVSKGGYYWNRET